MTLARGRESPFGPFGLFHPLSRFRRFGCGGSCSARYFLLAMTKNRKHANGAPDAGDSRGLGTFAGVFRI